MKSTRSARWLALFATTSGCTLRSATPTPSQTRTTATAPNFVESSADVIIVGGGLAGLVSAYELEKRGLSVHLLEMREVLGGRVATADYGNGLLREYGMQEMWTGNPLLDIAKELNVPLDDGVVSGYKRPHRHLQVVSAEDS